MFKPSNRFDRANYQKVKDRNKDLRDAKYRWLEKNLSVVQDVLKTQTEFTKSGARKLKKNQAVIELCENFFINFGRGNKMQLFATFTNIINLLQDYKNDRNNSRRNKV